MVLWVFLDSALLNHLSRDITISIWRDGLLFKLLLFHVVGVFAFILKLKKKKKSFLY